MGCFLACFGGDKDRKQRRRPKNPLPINRVNQSYRALQPSPSPQNPVIREAAAAADVAALPEPREKQENARISSCRKKVTFNLNVKTYEDVDVGEGVEDSLELEDESNGHAPETVSPGSNYRYQNCESSDDECVDDDDDADEYDDDSDFDEEDDNEIAVVGAEEESYESFFSLPMDKEKQQEEDNSEEVDSPMPIGVLANGGARDRSQYVHSVLNPVENLSQWKEAKAWALQLKNRNGQDFDIKLETKAKNADKENSQFGLETKVTGFSPEPTFKGNRPRKPVDSVPTPNHSNNKEEISVDTSLSTWLVSSENGPRGETTPQGSISRWSNSPVSREEQPILGALTVEDLKQSSATPSPRKSPIRTPDDIPILGTVGSYWSTSSQNSDPKGIPNSTSKYREDKKVNWHSTPFEVRLERALNTDRSC